MSPAAFYCWLSERRWLWFLRHRFQPRPDQNYPAAIALVMPFVVTGVLMVLFGVLTTLLIRLADPGGGLAFKSFFFGLFGAFVFTAAIVHWGFTWLVWNQRATRLRARGSPTTDSP